MQEIDINVTLFLIVSTFLFYLFIFYRCYNYENVCILLSKLPSNYTNCQGN
jgi:hypothetical protein